MNEGQTLIDDLKGKMRDKLAVTVLGNRQSGKSHTWDTLFGRTVKTGVEARRLDLGEGACVDVFLVSGSPEERHLYVGKLIQDVDCRIVLCSMQYTDSVGDTIDYFLENKFQLYLQWLNPGFNDLGENWDRLGLVSRILAEQSWFSIRDARGDASRRVEELRDFIRGWAGSRGLLYQAS